MFITGSQHVFGLAIKAKLFCERQEESSTRGNPNLHFISGHLCVQSFVLQYIHYTIHTLTDICTFVSTLGKKEIFILGVSTTTTILYTKESALCLPVDKKNYKTFSKNDSFFPPLKYCKIEAVAFHRLRIGSCIWTL